MRSLYGTRGAPARWEELYTTTLEGLGFQRGWASACCCFHLDHDIRCDVHGDDFTFTGYDEDLSWIQAAMEKAFCQGGPGSKNRTVFIDDVTVYTGCGQKA